MLSKLIDRKKRPYIQAELLEPNSEAYSFDDRDANYIRVYCTPSMDLEEQKNFIKQFEIGQKFLARPNQIAHSVPLTCMGDFADHFAEPGLSQDIKVPKSAVTQATFTVSNLKKDLVDAVEQRIKSEDLTRTFVVKRLLDGFVAGKYDDDIL